jgi:enamine deaminase RidA (YjgF/YER057c/UK114 family)
MSIELRPPSHSELPIAAAAIGGGLVFVTVVPDEEDGTIRPEGIEYQSRLLIANLERTLRESRSSLRSVLHVTLYVTDVRHREAFTQVWIDTFAPDFPARATIGVAELAHPDMLLEISAVALEEGAR